VRPKALSICYFPTVDEREVERDRLSRERKAEREKERERERVERGLSASPPRSAKAKRSTDPVEPAPLTLRERKKEVVLYYDVLLTNVSKDVIRLVTPLPPLSCLRMQSVTGLLSPGTSIKATVSFTPSLCDVLPLETEIRLRTTAGDVVIPVRVLPDLSTLYRRRIGVDAVSPSMVRAPLPPSLPPCHKSRPPLTLPKRLLRTDPFLGVGSRRVGDTDRPNQCLTLLGVDLSQCISVPKGVPVRVTLSVEGHDDVWSLSPKLHQSAPGERAREAEAGGVALTETLVDELVGRQPLSPSLPKAGRGRAYVDVERFYTQQHRSVQFDIGRETQGDGEGEGEGEGERGPGHWVYLSCLRHNSRTYEASLTVSVCALSPWLQYRPNEDGEMEREDEAETVSEERQREREREKGMVSGVVECVVSS
ncbi:hypothetical protein KIPB_003375, partial [Kipferlia bialata]